MENNEIDLFLTNYFGKGYSLEVIEGSASDRRNFVVTYQKNKYILTEGENINENKSFIFFANFFYEKGLNVPKIIKVNQKGNIYLQENVGEKTLLEILSEEKESIRSKKLYKEAIKQLINFQVEGKKGIKLDWCFDFSEFNKLLILQDLFYFKNHFLDLLTILYAKKNLIEDFHKFSLKLENTPNKMFVHRDFQARNIMIKDEKPFIIDFQGGMVGPPTYDLISLIWQSRANLSAAFKEELKLYYFNQLNEVSSHKFEASDFEVQYNLCLIIRQLQTLGAYGFRGIYQKKEQFTNSILQSIENLNAIIELDLMNDFGCLKAVLKEIILIPENKIKSIINGK